MLLAYDEKGTGPVVVLLHGFPLNRSMWSGQIEVLGSKSRVLTPDLRGHGDSPAPAGLYPMDALAEDVLGLLEGLKINEPIVLGGLSMGGYVALAFASKYPDRLQGLMLLNTRSAADASEAAQKREELAQKVEKLGSVEPVVEQMIPKLFAGSTTKDRPELVERIAQQMRRTSVDGVCGSLRGMAIRPDRRDDLKQIQVPTLVLAGAEDQLIPEQEAREMAERLPKATLVVVPKAGHLAPLEQPEATNTAILKFMETLA